MVLSSPSAFFVEDLILCLLPLSLASSSPMKRTADGRVVVGVVGYRAERNSTAWAAIAAAPAARGDQGSLEFAWGSPFDQGLQAVVGECSAFQAVWGNG